MRRIRILLVGVVAVLATAAAGLSPTAGGQRPALEPSPPGRILVVNANVKAAFDNHVPSSGERMRVFVDRLLDDIRGKGGRWLPDVVLLQEALTPELWPGLKLDLSATRVA